MGYAVYILVNRIRTCTYVGQTADVEGRLRLHNEGRVRSTRGDGPWEILYTEECATRSAAMKRERWFKSRLGRQSIKKMILERWPSG